MSGAHGKLIPVHKATKEVPPDGVDISTLFRWMQRGVRGVRLESVVVGGKRYTTLEAIERFIQKTTNAGELSSFCPSTPAGSHAADRAAQELIDAGL